MTDAIARFEERTMPSGPGSDTDPRSPLLRFCDTFLREQNIKWMLGVGMLILLGSSLMLVTSHWDAYTPVWKHLILLGYTAGLHAIGQVVYRSLGLRKTGTGLMALTVLLIPLTFLALRWTHPAESLSLAAIARHAGLLTLLAANVAFAVTAAVPIFRHFLRRTQPTFVASYLILSVAGAAIPAIPAAAAGWVTLLLWGVFAAGAMKVNRHVFWLAEEHRLPRIVGFFPILLLGGQFLTLFAAGLAPHLRMEWIGLGCVLTAIPVLLTANTLARLHLEVHGQPARPLPWGVALPMIVGLVLTLDGVCLAGARFPEASSLVPAAALAAAMMGVVARRTGRRVFAWAMLAGIVLAYQSTPVFFRELARQVVQQGAAAVREQRLPIAFYGLTYLPLLAATTLAAAIGRRRREVLFTPALCAFSVGLPVVLLAAALSHAKAMLPVSLALCGLFSVQSVLFRDRRTVGLGVLAFCLAAFGFEPFALGVLGIEPHRELPLLAWGIAAALLLVPGARIDRRTSRWLAAESIEKAIPLCQSASLILTLITMGVWLVRAAMPLPVASAPPIAGTLIAGLMIAHALRWRHARLSEGALAFAVIGPALIGLSAGLSLYSAATLATLLLGGLWLAVPALERRRKGLVVGTFAGPARRVACAGLIAVFALWLVPHWALSLLMGASFPAWIAAIGVTGWMFHAARRLPAPWLTIGGWVGLLATAGVAFVAFGPRESREWLPALWSAMAVAAIPAVRRAGGLLGGCAIVTLALVAVASLANYTLPLRVAGGVAFVGLLLTARFGRSASMRDAARMLVGWQTLVGVMQFFAPDVRNLEGWSLDRFASAALPVALLASVQAIAWQRRLRRMAVGAREVAVVQRMGLLSAAAASLLSGFALLPDRLSAWQVAVAVAAFAVLTADRIVTALRIANEASTGDERRAGTARVEAEANVWGAELIVAAGIGYLALFGVIRFGHGLSMFVTLAAGLVAWGLAEAARRSPKHDVLAGPLRQTAMCLPAAAVAIGVGRHLTGIASPWLGMNSLALFLAAGFYFWRGLERRHPGLLIGSAAIVNAALALLWRELEWLDPQLFLIPVGVSVLGLVEVLREEIPPKFHDPLRYVGALAILVSPTFHIVEGSWLHLFSLMAFSVAITLMAMGLRVKALMYTGTAFLVADVVAMVVRGSIDEPSILWIAGIALGALVIGLAAYCERHREQMLQRLRLIAAELETWQ